MQIGELFLSLGVKGAEKTLGALNSARRGMKEGASDAFAMKAAIVGVMYTLERLFSASNKAGTNLTNFNATLGISAKTLQQYQYAAQQVGVSNQEMASTFGSLQSVMTKTLMGEGAPKGLARVSMLTGEISAEDLARFAKNPELLLQRLQKYAQLEQNAGLRNEVLRSFNIGDGVNAALTRNAFRPDVLAKAPTYSEGEQKALDKTNAKWANLGQKIEMAVGHFNAKHGDEMIEGISKITDKVLALADALQKFAEKTNAFGLIGKSIEGWSLIFKGVTDNVGKLDMVFQGWKTIFDGLEKVFTAIYNATQNDAAAAELKGDVVTTVVDTATPVLKGLKDNAVELLEDAPMLFQQLMRDAFTDGQPGVTAVVPDVLGSPDKPVATAPTVPGQPVTTAPVAPSTVPFEKPTMAAPVAPAPPVPPGGKPQASTGNLKLAPPVAPNMPVPAAAAAPTMPATAIANNVQTQTINVAQSLNFQHEGKDAARTGDSVKRAVSSAFRQLSAQAQGT